MSNRWEIDDNRTKSGHRYNVAEQNKAYAQEVERIWRAQYQALSSKVEPELSDDEDGAATTAAASTSKPLGAMRGLSVSRDMGAADSPGAFSRASSVDYTHDGQHRLTRVLKIQRFVSDCYCVLLSTLLKECEQVDGEWRKEFVRDPHVIKAYIRAKEEQELLAQNVETFEPTGDADKDKKMLERYVVREHTLLER